MPEDSARLFTALWPDPALSVRLAAERDAWHWPPGAKQVADANLHLTLHFLGAFPRARVAALEGSLAALPVVPMALRALGPELFRGGIAVLRFAADDALHGLHLGIGAVVAGHGVALDARPFAPHVTLARRARGAVAPARPPTLDWHASGFALVESLPGSHAAYRVVRSFGSPPPPA